jgi:nicotinamidase/pyrazinamidase
MKSLLLEIGGILFLMILGTVLTLVISFKKITKITKGGRIKKYKKSASALVIIDVQKNLVIKGGKLAVDFKQANIMIENINTIIQNVEVKDVKVIYIKNAFEKKSIINYMSGRTMEEGSAGTEIDDRIKIVSSNIFLKNKMDSFTNHDFEKYLISNEISHLIIVGLDAEDCVDKTIKGAINRNYRITVISDAIASKTDIKRNKKINDFKNMKVEVLATEELMNKSNAYNMQYSQKGF